MARTIKDVMTAEPVCLTGTDTALDAAQQMRSKDMGDVIVAGADGRLEGIVTDRDLVLRVMADGADPAEVNLQDVITSDVTTLSPSDPVQRAIDVMRDHAIRRIPVVENGKPVGIVSLGDLARTNDPSSVLADISEAPPQN